MNDMIDEKKTLMLYLVMDKTWLATYQIIYILNCECRVKLKIQHVLSCKKVDFVSNWHNQEVRNITVWRNKKTQMWELGFRERIKLLKLQKSTVEKSEGKWLSCRWQIYNVKIYSLTEWCHLFQLLCPSSVLHIQR